MNEPTKIIGTVAYIIVAAIVTAMAAENPTTLFVAIAGVIDLVGLYLIKKGIIDSVKDLRK